MLLIFQMRFVYWGENALYGCFVQIHPWRGYAIIYNISAHEMLHRPLYVTHIYIEHAATSTCLKIIILTLVIPFFGWCEE